MPPTPLALDDDAMAAVLATAGEIGPGTVARAIRECARRHFDPPTDTGVRAGKYK